MMLKVVFCLFLLISLKAGACCSAGQLRIFPLGMIQNKPLCAVFETSRACSDDGMGPENEILWFGRMSLMFLEKDSLRLFKALDTFEFVECVCDYDEIESKSNYIQNMQSHLETAYMFASKESNFIPFLSSVYAADKESINAQFEHLSDTIAIWKKEEIDLRKNESISCFMMNELKEIRIYKTAQFELLIASVGCPTERYLSKEIERKNSEAFKSKRNAITYIPVDWHGYTIDLYRLLELKS